MVSTRACGDSWKSNWFISKLQRHIIINSLQSAGNSGNFQLQWFPAVEKFPQISQIYNSKKTAHLSSSCHKQPKKIKIIKWAEETFSSTVKEKCAHEELTEKKSFIAKGRKYSLIKMNKKQEASLIPAGPGLQFLYSFHKWRRRWWWGRAVKWFETGFNSFFLLLSGLSNKNQRTKEPKARINHILFWRTPFYNKKKTIILCQLALITSIRACVRQVLPSSSPSASCECVCARLSLRSGYPFGEEIFARRQAKHTPQQHSPH